jgi:transposase-like protein
MKQQQQPTIHRRKYDEQFKREALRMIDTGQSVRSVAQALGVAESQLHKWKRQFQQTRSVGEAEVAELTKRLRQVEQERDI